MGMNAKVYYTEKYTYKFAYTTRTNYASYPNEQCTTNCVKNSSFEKLETFT